MGKEQKFLPEVAVDGVMDWGDIAFKTCAICGDDISGKWHRLLTWYVQTGGNKTHAGNTYRFCKKCYNEGFKISLRRVR